MGRVDLVNALADLLDHSDGEHITIGLMGIWGTGKSTVLSLLKKELRCRQEERLWFGCDETITCWEALVKVLRRYAGCWGKQRARLTT